MKFKILLMFFCLYAINNNTMQQGNKLIRPVLTTGVNAMKGGLSSGAPVYGLHSHYRVADKVKSVKDLNEFLSSSDNIKKMKLMSRDELFDMFRSEDIKDEEFKYLMLTIDSFFSPVFTKYPITYLHDEFFWLDYLALLDYTALKNLYEIVDTEKFKKFLIKASHCKAIAKKYPHLFDKFVSYEKVNENFIELLNDHAILEKYPVDFLEYFLAYLYSKRLRINNEGPITKKIDWGSFHKFIKPLSLLKNIEKLRAGSANAELLEDVINSKNVLSTSLMKKMFQNSKIPVEKYQAFCDHISQLMLQDGNNFSFLEKFFKSDEEVIRSNFLTRTLSNKNYLEEEFKKFLNK